MVKETDVSWFKRQFAARIAAAVQGTPLTVDHVTAIALQETGYIWARLQRKGLPTSPTKRPLARGDKETSM